jgi:hypothetical protein
MCTLKLVTFSSVLSFYNRYCLASVLRGTFGPPSSRTNCTILRTLRKIPKGFFNFRCTILRMVPCQTIFPYYILTTLWVYYICG